METFRIIVEIGLCIGLFILVGWLKKLPDAIHDRQKQLFQQELNKEIEQLKSSLARDLESFKISQAQLQLRKTDEFIKFAKSFRVFLTDSGLKKQLANKDPRAVKKIANDFVELGMHIFFFASDDTIRKYVDWRVKSQRGDFSGTQILEEFGELMILFRKDLGYTNKAVGSGDFLALILSDWNNTAQ